MMKIAFLSFFIFPSIHSKAGFSEEFELPTWLYEFCPNEQEMLLEVVTFMPSADSRSSKGQCIVSAPAFSWYDLIRPHEKFNVKIDVGSCNSNEFIRSEEGLFVKASVFYKASISFCGSKAGCHTKCEPIVKLREL